LAYNPNAYVPGYASPKVAKAIQKLGYQYTPPTKPIASPPIQGESKNDTPFTTPADPVTGRSLPDLNWSTPAWEPDYEALINGDPTYKAAVAGVNAEHNMSLDQRNANARSAVIQGGYDISSLLGGKNVGDINSYLSPADYQAARENQYSTAAGEGFQHNTNVQTIFDSLAARGLARSGQAGFDQGNEQRRFDQSNYTNTQNLLGYLGGIQQAYADSEAARTGRLEQARSAAAQFQAGLPQNQPRGATKQTAHWNGTAYEDADGNLYDANGVKLGVATRTSNSTAPPGSGLDPRTLDPRLETYNPIPYYNDPSHAGPDPTRDLAYQIATGVAAGGTNHRRELEI
jgi:hypothetical protein